jgi:hypothetical protein
MLREMSSRELTCWQVFLKWRHDEQRKRQREQGDLGDDGDVTHW